MTDWREIPASEIEWSANPINKLAGRNVENMCGREGPAEDTGQDDSARMRKGGWTDLTLGEIADLGEQYWILCEGIGYVAVEVIKWVIDHAAAGKCPMKAGSGKPAHDAYRPRPIEEDT